MPLRGRRLPLTIVGVFLVSCLLLLVGIHQTSHLSRHKEDITFGPPVPRHGRSLKNVSVIGDNKTAGQAEREAREAARANKRKANKEDGDTPDDIKNVNITDTSGNVTVTDLRPKSFPHSPKVQYLGVLVDAGRHYFPISWLKDLVDTLYRMKYNFIHFRLTDDQAFNVRLESHPELAKPSAVLNPKGQVYSVEELADLVQYALERNITIMPEVNVPGHAGAWAGIPNFVVPCPEFICLKGYGIPLNISHPQMLSTIKDVIEEVRDIFQTSPYLHLGGDEVEMSQACFSEANTLMFNYTKFEADLEGVLVELDIPLDKVLRWEMTPGRHKVAAKDRAGKLTHHWIGQSYKKATEETNKTFFVSQGLYFDSNQGANGWSIYSTAKMQASLQNQPTAIIGGTFELSTVTWVDRNVLGRLLAVAMGAAGLNYKSTADFEKAYGKYCNSLGLEGCSAMGMPILNQKLYMNKWNKDWDVWKGDICTRLTIDHVEPIMNRQDRVKQQTLAQASQEFWNSFGLPHPAANVVEVVTDNGKSSIASLPELAIGHLGLVVDLVHGTGHLSQNGVQILKSIIDDMGKFGFNLLQLRIMNEFGMAVKLHSLPHLAFLTEGKGIWSYETIRQVVEYASEKGIQVMPEISISTRAGGWANAGILAECPNVICDGGQGIAVDTRDSSDMQIFALVLRELRGLFSSQYLHLGYDERKEAMDCYREANIENPNLEEWEQRLEAVLRLEGIPENKVWRWENTEGILYPHRAGLVTNYQSVSSVKNTTAPFFVSTNLGETGKAWDIYQRTREIAQAAPSGIMVSVESVENWDSLQIRERLLTFSMGSRKMDLKDESSFQTSFTEACKSLELKNCDAFISPDAASASHQLDMETKRKLLTKKLCDTRTTKKSVKRPRKGVLVSD